MDPCYDSFRGKVAIVTGAAQGIGRAVAETLAAGGAAVALVDVRTEAIEATAGALRERGAKAIAVVADVSDGASVRGMVDTVVRSFGTVDILVNNAGVLRNTPIVEMPESEWDLVVDVCLKMMAKKPAHRYASARQVADALADWLRIHGHSIESGVGLSGSSGRLLVAAAEPDEAPAARRAGGPAPPTSAQGGAGSDKQRPVARAPDQTVAPDTHGAVDQATETGAAASGPSAGTADADPQVADRSALPKAQRLDQSDPLAEILAEARAARRSRIEPITALSDEELEAYRRRRQKVPLWLWLAVVGGSLLTVLLLVLALLWSR